MTERNNAYRSYISNKEHHVLRTDKAPDPALFTTGEYHVRMKNRFKALLELQDPVFIENEMFVPTRTCVADPDILTENDPEIKNGALMHERGWLSNVCPDYGKAINLGLLGLKREILASAKATSDKAKKDYANTMIESIDAILEFTERYRKAAIEAGKTDIATVLERVPAYGATTYREALQSFRMIHFCLWLEGNYHVTVGRFDQYMLPYLLSDMEKGSITYDEALEMTENLFITFNKDSDLYIGMQMGDNGQSMMLGGRDVDGNDKYNILSEICIKASLGVQMIDPKINLRVDKNTPYERFVFGSELTATGMGFPQYSNDDIVLPALIDYGYDPEDAVNYTVAACWEFIIPGLGMEIHNLTGLSFPDCVNTVIRRDLEKCEDFASFLIFIDEEIKARAKAIEAKYVNIFCRPAPLMSAIMTNCTKTLTDVTLGNKYNNYGVHGVGVATAADSIAAVNSLVFNGHMSVDELKDMLDKNFEGYEEIRTKILTKFPHMGNNDDAVDQYAVMLLDSFAKALKGLKNDRGGIFRAGTGTAMFYASGRDTGASADGRRAEDYLPTNYSPTLGVKLNGPLSIIQSFAKPNLRAACNGGPLTLELASTAVKDREGIEKTAFIVKKFVELGGHQMQLNVVNREKLTDAQIHPEKYKNLVVRVWGWSGYFTELDKVYQDQILSRTEYNV